LLMSLQMDIWRVQIDEGEDRKAEPYAYL
jgi:hypothetical protein